MQVLLLIPFSSVSFRYNIVSHLKTISILVLGSVIFRDHLLFQQVVGMILAMCGIIDYSLVRLAIKNKKAKQAAQTPLTNPPATSSTTEGTLDDGDNKSQKI